MTDADWDNLSSIVGWFGEAATVKYTVGSREHGGELRQKGGLVAEAENEILDQAIYVRTIRKQLDGVLCALDSGHVSDAAAALRFILYGSPQDRLSV
jgi:hypothetical protein